MIRINLLPTEEVERAADQRQQLAAVGLVLAVGVFGLVVMHSWQAARVASAQRRLDQVRDELQAITGPYADVMKIQAQQRDLEEKLKVIAQLEAKSAGPVRMLADLSSATPEKLWLIDFAEAGGVAKVSGFSVDEQTIADFLRRLSQSPYFKTVDLEETTQVTVENVKQKKFTLRAQLNYAGAAPVAKPAAPPQKTAAAGAPAPTMTASRGKVTP
jgi:Tfp pilus assembly protein PilN